MLTLLEQKRRMSSIKHFCLALVTVMVMSVSACANATKDLNGNQIANPNFDKLDGPMPADWLIDESSQAKGKVEMIKQKNRDSYRLKLTPGRSNSSDVLAMNMAQAFQVGPYKGKDLTISASLGGKGGAEAVVMVTVIDKAGQSLANVVLRDASSGGKLKRHEAGIRIPKNKRAALMLVLAQVRGDKGVAFFDNISMVVGGGGAKKAGASAAAGKAAASTSKPKKPNQAASIVVHAGKTLRRIPRGVYGVNVSWAIQGSGIMQMPKGNFNPQVMKLTKQLKTPLIRYPGGTMADYYNWRHGLGPLSKRRKTVPIGHDGQEYQHVFGTEEAIDFANKAGGRLLITVNVGTGTAKQAADWVRHVNGSGDPSRRVDYWEVGNEVYIKGSGSVAIPPRKYVKKFLQFEKAMREADPTIKIGALGSENYFKDTEYEYSYKDWTKIILKELGSKMDFLAIHNAYAPSLLGGGQEKDVESVYKAMLAAPLLIEQNLREVNSAIDKYAPGNANNIEIAVTEWGPFFAFSPDNRYMDHVKTIGSALFTGSMLKRFVETPRLDVANFFQLTSFTPLTLIATRDGVSIHDFLANKKNLFQPNASYYAFKMFTRHFGSVALHSEVSSGTFNAPAAGWVDPVNDVPYLEVVASRNKKRNRLYLIVINKHFDAAIRTNLTVNDFVPAEKAKTWTLTGGAIDAHTGTRPMKVPGAKWAKPAKARKRSRMDQGSMQEVRIVTGNTVAGKSFRYSFPPHSITAIELVQNQ